MSANRSSHLIHNFDRLKSLTHLGYTTNRSRRQRNLISDLGVLVVIELDHDFSFVPRPDKITVSKEAAIIHQVSKKYRLQESNLAKLSAKDLSQFQQEVQS